MLYQLPEILQVLADIVGAILTVLGPIVTPIGEFMVLWIDYVLIFFQPFFGDYVIFIVVFEILFIIAIFVNTNWSGDKPRKKEEELEGEEEKGVEFEEEKKEEDLFENLELEDEEEPSIEEFNEFTPQEKEKNKED